MRPDELAAEEEIRRSQGRDKSLVKGISAGAAALGVGASARVLPFLSEFIPADLSIKGINKVFPKLGQSLEKGKSMGLNIQDGLNFVKDNLLGSSKKQNPLEDFENNHIILATALSNDMKKGETPEMSAKRIKNSRFYKKDIEKIEKETGKNFVDYILEIFGNMQQQPSQMQAQPQPEQTQGQPQPSQMQQDQGGGLDQQIMAALDKILKM